MKTIIIIQDDETLTEEHFEAFRAKGYIVHSHLTSSLTDDKIIQISTDLRFYPDSIQIIGCGFGGMIVKNIITRIKSQKRCFVIKPKFRKVPVKFGVITEPWDEIENVDLYISSTDVNMMDFDLSMKNSRTLILQRDFIKNTVEDILSRI